MIEREIISVGQGSFNIETVGRKKVIYDCGSTKRTLVNARIEKYLKRDEVIDVLVISHMDYDHISGVKHLLKHCKINKIFLPQMTPLKTILLWYFSSSSEEELREVRNMLATFYSSKLQEYGVDLDNLKLEINHETSVHYIKLDSNIEGENSTIDNLDRDQKDISYKIMLFEHEKYCDWILMFFYKDDSSKTRKFESWLDEKSYEIDDKDLWMDEVKVKEIKEEYKKIIGDHNDNGMTMYSGPSKRRCRVCVTEIELKISHLFSPTYLHASKINGNRLGILYTGDISIKRDDDYNVLVNWYQDVVDEIYMIQVPHHGSIHNFNNKMIGINKYKNNFYFTNASSNNQHGHPHGNVVMSFKIENHLFYLIDEDDYSSIFFNVYDWFCLYR